MDASAYTPVIVMLCGCGDARRGRLEMKTLLLLGALTVPVIAFAQPTPDPAELEPMVVTATGHPTAAADTLAPLLVLTRAEIERSQASDLAELLRFFAGVELGRNGGTGSTTSVFIRGGESNHTLILIDGVRVNPASSGGAALQNIAPAMIERIEVVKGPRASLYGSDAIGGVINVITRNSADGGSAEAQLRGGSYNTWDGSLRGSYAGPRGSISVQAQQLQTDGYAALVDYGKRAGYDRTSLNLDGRLDVGAATVGAQLWDSRGEAEYYGYDSVSFDRVVVAQNYRNQVAAVDARMPFGPGVEGSLRWSQMLDQIDQQRNADFIETDRSGIDGTLTWRHDLHRVTGGLGFIKEKVDAASYGTMVAEDRDLLSLRLQDEVSWGANQVVAGVTWTDYDFFGARWDGSLDYGYAISSNTRIVASAGTGFRAPDATDRYGFGGNPDLEPEAAKNYELGWQQRLGKNQRLDLRIFQSDVDNLINVICDASFNCTAVNVDRYRNQGAELTYTLRDLAWSATLTGLLQDPEDRSTGQQLLRRAKRSAAVKLQRDFGAWNAGLDLLTSSSRPDFGGQQLGGYALVNLLGGLRVNADIDLRLRVENLLDKDYQTAGGYRQQGASLYASISYRL